VILFVTLSGTNAAKPASSSMNDVPTPSIRRHTSAPTTFAPTTDQVTLIPTTTLVPTTNSDDQDVLNTEHIMDEISVEARVESSRTTNHATVRAEALKHQRLRTEAMWGNVAHQGGASKIQQASSSSKGSKVPYSKKAVQ
jgi:hypothetical protein